MIYLSGVTNDRDEPAMVTAGIGLMAQPGNSYHLRVLRYPWWAADNGCFADRWTEDRWVDWLGALPRERCLFAVAPDVYPDAAASVERLLQWSPVIREMGFPVALVAQDGAEGLQLPWGDLDVLFLGGAKTVNPRDEWKLGIHAEAVAREARRQGKWVHMGRVNSLKRLERARQMGCHSADGTFIKYRRRRRAADPHEDARDGRGASELEEWGDWLRMFPTLPTFLEGPSLPVHRDALS